MKPYSKNITGKITLIIDLLSMILSFTIAGYIRGGIINSRMMSGIYGSFFVVLILSAIVIHNTTHFMNIVKRGFFEEFIFILKEQAKLGLILLGFIFAIKQGSNFSRIFIFLFFLLNILIVFVARSYMKIIMLLAYKKSSSSRKVMLITISKSAPGIIRRIKSEYEWNANVSTIALLDKSRIGEKIEGVEVVADRDNLLDMAMLRVVDEVFIHLPNKFNMELEELILELEKMGIIVHMNLNIFNNLNVKEKIIDEFISYQVITYSSKLFDQEQVILKRLMDIGGSLIGCLATILLTIILTPIILIESPGPVFFSQTRVGKNGRKFKIYKFRSMHRDADQRKAELMNHNEINGPMFKMENDPRITKVGRFIRKTSLDEFPQFFNVLKGDMSLVGTRPPTEDEFERYETRHRRRLSLKPGLTGLWQVSGRSDIDNFEDVVKLDLQYIDNWSFKLDLKLMLKTIGVVVLGKGSR